MWFFRDSRFKISHSIGTGKLQFGGKSYDFTSEDMQDLGEIGRGGFGTVNKMIHRKSGMVLAVKRIRSTVDEKEQKQLLMDLDVVMKSNECVYIVQFYGALFKEVTRLFVLFLCVFVCIAVFVGGLLDLHGTHGYLVRQILQVHL